MNLWVAPALFSVPEFSWPDDCGPSAVPPLQLAFFGALLPTQIVFRFF